MKTSRLLLWLMMMLSPIVFFTACDDSTEPAPVVEGTVSGTLLDEQGISVAEALVSALDAQDKVVAEATTDEDGKFSFVLKGADENTLKVRITGFDFKPFTGSFKSIVSGNSGKKENINIPMLHEEDACGQIRVVVRDSSAGNLMNEVEVKLRREGRQMKKTWTNASGEALLKYVAEGTYNLRLFREGFKVIEQNVSVGGNCDSVNVSFWMNRVMSNNDSCVNGKIILYTKDSTTNAAIQNATIKLWLGGVLKQTKTSDQNGRIAFEGLTPGTYNVGMNREGYAGKEFNVTVTCNQTIELTKKLFSNGGGEDSCLNGKIILYTKDSTTNAAIQNATIKLWLGNALKQTKTSESNGRVVFEGLRPGNYSISMNREGYAGKEFNITVGCNQTIELTKKLLSNGGGNDSCLNGKLILYTKDSTTAAALANATIKLWLGGVLKQTKTSDQNGRTVFEGLRPGTYGISINREGYPVREFNFTIACDQTIEVTKKLLSNGGGGDSCTNGKIILYAKDSTTTAAIANATIKLWLGGVLKQTKTSDGNGRVVFENLAPGTYNIGMNREGYAGREFNITVTCNQQIELTKKLLSNGGGGDSCLNGKIILYSKDSTTNAALQNATVKLWLGGTLKQTKTSDGNGRVAFENLAPGNYSISINREGYGAREFNITVTCNQQIELTKKLLSNSNECNGKIILYSKDSTTNAAIQNATVKLWLGGTLKQTKTSDANGRVAFENLAPGNYSISINREGYAGKEFTVTVTCNQQIELTKKLLSNSSGECCTAQMRIRVKDSTNSEWLNGATVIVKRGNETIRQGTTSGEGSVLFENLCAPESYTITVSRQGFGSKTITLSYTTCALKQETVWLMP